MSQFNGKEERLKEFEDSIFNFLEYLKKAENERISRQIRERDAAYVDAQKDYIKIYGQADTTERNLEALRKSIKIGRPLFEDDFELINKMRGVRKIEVREEVLTVFTEPLVQVVGVKQFDIGQYAIIVDYSGKPAYSRGVIRFKKGPDIGLFRHANAVEPSPAGSHLICFGNDTEVGLNNSMDKLCADCDIVPIIHLILAFLQRDTVEPNSNEQIPGPENFKDYSSYATAEERETEKAMFAAFCTNIRSKLATRGLEVELVKLNKELLEKREKALTARGEVRATTELYNAVSRIDAEELRRIAREEARTFSAYNQVVRIANERGTLLVFFRWHGRDWVFELSPGNPPRIRRERYDVGDLSGILTSNGYLKTDVKLLITLADLAIQSKISSVFRILLGAIKDSQKFKEGPDGLIR